MKKLIMVAIVLPSALGALAYAQTTPIKNNGANEVQIDSGSAGL